MSEGEHSDGAFGAEYLKEVSAANKLDAPEWLLLCGHLLPVADSSRDVL